MADHSSPFLLELWQHQMNDSTTYWQELFKAQSRSIKSLTQWQSCIDQHYAEWSSLWQQWQNTLGQWLTNWSDLSSYALQSNVPYGMLFPSSEDITRLNRVIIQLMEQCADGVFTGLGALGPGRAAELTEQVSQLETAVSDLNQYLEAMTTRLETSVSSEAQAELPPHMRQLETAIADVNQYLETMTARLESTDAAVTAQVDTLRDQIQATHEVTTQQLTVLAKRLDAMATSPKRSTPRKTPQRKPKS